MVSKVRDFLMDEGFIEYGGAGAFSDGKYNITNDFGV